MKKNNLRYYTDLLRGKKQETCGQAINNILRSYNASRGGDLSGEDFTGIDFGYFPLSGFHFDGDGTSPAVFDNASLSKYNFIHGHEDECRDIFFVRDVKKNEDFLLSYDSHEIILWDIYSGSAVEVIKHEDENITNVGLSQDGNIIIYSTDKNKLFCKNIFDIRNNMAYRCFDNYISHCNISPNGKYAAVVIRRYIDKSKLYVLKIFSINNGEFVQTDQYDLTQLSGDKENNTLVLRYYLHFSDDSKSVAAGFQCINKSLHLMKADIEQDNNRRYLYSLLECDTLRNIYFSPNNKYVLYYEGELAFIHCIFEGKETVAFHSKRNIHFLDNNDPFSFVRDSVVLFEEDDLICYNIKTKKKGKIADFDFDDLNHVVLSPNIDAAIVFGKGEVSIYQFAAHTIRKIIDSLNMWKFGKWNQTGNICLVSNGYKVWVRDVVEVSVNYDFLVSNCYFIFNTLSDCRNRRVLLLGDIYAYENLKIFIQSIVAFSFSQLCVESDAFDCKDSLYYILRELPDMKKRKIDPTVMRIAAIVSEEGIKFCNDNASDIYDESIYDGGSARNELFGRKSGINYITWSSDGSVQAECCNDMIRIRKTDTMKLIKEISFKSDETVVSASITSDNKRIAVITEHYSFVFGITVHKSCRPTKYSNREYHGLVTGIPFYSTQLNDVCFSYNGQNVIIADVEGFYYVWDMSGKVVSTQIKKDIKARTVSLFENGKHVIYNMGSHVIILNVRTKEEKVVYNVPNIHVRGCSFLGCKTDEMTRCILEQYGADI